MGVEEQGDGSGRSETCAECSLGVDGPTTEGLPFLPAPHQPFGISVQKNACLPHQLPPSARLPAGGGRQENRNVPKSAALHSLLGRGPGRTFPDACAPCARPCKFSTALMEARRTGERGSRSPRSRDTLEAASTFATLCKHPVCLVPEHSHPPQADLHVYSPESPFLWPLETPSHG